MMKGSCRGCVHGEANHLAVRSTDKLSDLALRTLRNLLLGPPLLSVRCLQFPISISPLLSLLFPRDFDYHFPIDARYDTHDPLSFRNCSKKHDFLTIKTETIPEKH
jgi:hypothetical protein